MISVEEARAKILEKVEVLGTERKPILDAVGQVLAEDIMATVSLPLFDNSAMDGYALRAADLSGVSENAPVTLKVVGDLAAGYVSEREVGSGEAIRIMTGAPVPQGADAVVMVERTEPDFENGTVNILTEAKIGENIRRRGEELTEGDLIIQKGKVLNGADIGLLASNGIAEVTVVRRPVVAIIATGDEVIDITEELVPGKLRNSNSYALAAQVMRAGGVPKVLGIAKDTREEVARLVREGLKCDLLITTGGVSVGDFDMVKKVLTELGEMLLWKVAMKPGKPLAFGEIEGKLLFGLPGNPAASLISFELFVRPSLLKMQGRDKLLHPVIPVKLMSQVKKKPGRRHFVNVFVSKEADGYTATPVRVANSSMLLPMSVADGLLIFPEDASVIDAGEMCQALMTSWPEEVF